MRVLFLESHPMWIHGLPNGFRDAGHEVEISGPLTEARIIELLQHFQPDLIITMGWTQEHTPQKRAWIREYVGRSGIPHVFWATEDPTHHKTFSLPYVRTVKPNFVFTICRSKIKDYNQLGIPAAHMDFGFHQSVHRRNNPVSRYRSEIAVVANGYSNILKKYPKHYRIQSLRHLIKPLVLDRTRIDFWGTKWDQMKPVLGVQVPSEWLHGYLPYTEAYKVYNSAKVIIGPQNHLTQVTQRTYEILGSGGFLITSDTPEIRRLFKPGKELVVSRSPKQTRELIRYYLNHPKERENIRVDGQKAVYKHHYRYRAMSMIEQLQQHRIISFNHTQLSNPYFVL